MISGLLFLHRGRERIGVADVAEMLLAVSLSQKGVQRRLGERRQRIAGDVGTHLPEPQLRPASLEPGMPG